jgi:hypothetical protein
MSPATRRRILLVSLVVATYYTTATPPQDAVFLTGDCSGCHSADISGAGPNRRT